MAGSNVWTAADLSVAPVASFLTMWPARSNASCMLIMPEPTALAFPLVTASAEEVSAYLTWSGVRLGKACNKSAMAPETTAAAWLVPLPRNSLPLTSPDTRPCGLLASTYDPGSRRETREVPGAIRSACLPAATFE